MFETVNVSGCTCGKEHSFDSEIILEKGAINRLPEALKDVKKVFLIADKNTFEAAGKTVEALLIQNGITVKKHVFSEDALEPDEANVGLAIMSFLPDCQWVIGVGSGVINDISKIVASVSGKRYAIVATAPSMDGYASATSSMTVSGLKASLPSKCADLIIGDTDVLCRAPLEMRIAGLGDMLAKYVSICEWRISNLINGEYYCAHVAELVRESLKKCTDNALGLLVGEEKAVEAVFEGLILCGAAMKFAGVSRPASGVEHYFSHVWDMRGAELSEPVALHGLQCAVGTLIAVELYGKIKSTVPEKEKAYKYIDSFDVEGWNGELRAFLGKSAEAMIALEEKEHKYDKEAQKARFDVIAEKWEDILEIINEELPEQEELKALYKKMGLPMTMSGIGLDEGILEMTFKASKDIRDKYVLSRLCADLGIIDEII